MKILINKYILFITVLLVVVTSCEESGFDYSESNIELNSITGIKIYPNHYYLQADGKATIEINTTLFRTKDSIRVLKDRFDMSAVEYFDIKGNKLNGNEYSTNDASMIDKTVQIYAKVNGIISDTVKFEVKPPVAEDAYNEITIPVIFHVVQAENDINVYGGELPAYKVNKKLEQLNYAFSGELSRNPVGVDTKIRFKAAKFSPNGGELTEIGINRVTIDGIINSENKYVDLITDASNKLNWPTDKYLNIWLISDSKGIYENFSNSITKHCNPSAYVAGTDLTDKPEGLSLSEVASADAWTPEPKHTGIIFKLELLNKFQFEPGDYADNDLTYAVGEYLGLLSNFNRHYYDHVIADDHCDDTFNFNNRNGNNQSNKFIKKDDKYYSFLSENIMDDQQGLHRSVSKDQLKRMRWVLENCLGRSAWKSKFAFEGK